MYPRESACWIQKLRATLARVSEAGLNLTSYVLALTVMGTCVVEGLGSEECQECGYAILVGHSPPRAQQRPISHLCPAMLPCRGNLQPDSYTRADLHL